MVRGVVIPLIEPVADASGGQPEAKAMERCAVRGFTVEFQGVEAHLGRRPIRLGGSRQCANDRIGPPAHARLARDGVDTAAVGGHECRPAFRIGDGFLDFIDQPVQRAVPAVAHEVGDPWANLLHGLAEILDGGGFVHLAPRADDATQLGDAITPPGTILARERIDDDA